MTLAILTPSPAAAPRRATRPGDAVAALAHRYAAEMNGSAIAHALRERQLARRSYRGMIATMYPVVVGFNRALIRSIAKVDHVRSSSFVRVLARQLEEEQAHNQLWRGMLDVFDMDHELLYDDLEEFLAAAEPEEMDRRTTAVLLAVRKDLHAGAANEHFGTSVAEAGPEEQAGGTVPAAGAPV